MPSKHEKVLESVRCANPACGHLMYAANYLVANVLPDTPAEKVHRVHEPGQPERTFYCTCGHLTVHYAHRRSSERME